MNLQQIEATINKDNKFYWFLSSIKDTLLNDTILNLSEALLPTIINDINKPIIRIENEYDRSYNRSYSINFTSPGAELFALKYADGFSWDSDLPNKVLEFFQKAGMDFTQKKLTYTIKLADLPLFEKAMEEGNTKEVLENILQIKELREPILNLEDGYLDQPKYVSYLNAVSSQLPYENFLERIKDAGTLHTAVSRSASSIVNTLINSLNIPVNLKNKEGKTPVMFCNSQETHNVFANTKLDEVEWLAVDNKGNDALYYFGLLSNKDTSKTLVSSTQKIIKNLVGEDSNNANIIDESNKKALLGMVNSSKNKKEIEDFIKQTKIKDFTNIVDDRGRSMAQIVLTKDEWGKFELLSKGYPKSHRDKKGYSNLEYILVKTNPKYRNKAVSVLENELSNVSEDTGINMIKRFFRLDRPFAAPKWFISERKHVEFLRAFIGNDYTHETALEYFNVVKSNSNFDRLHSIEPHVLASLKEFVRPYFIHAINNGYQDEILDVELRKGLSSATPKYSDDNKKSYTISTEIFANLYALRELCVEYGLDYSKLDKKIEDTTIDFIKAAKEDLIVNPDVETNFKYQKDRFCQEVKHPFNYLMDCQSSRLMEVVDAEFLEQIKEANRYDTEFPKKLEVYMLGQSLINAKSNQEEVKIKKMKI